MSIPRPSALVKPTKNTKYHIDYSWWERQGDEDLRVYLMSHLLPEQRERMSRAEEGRSIDYIDPDTGEVFRYDELQLSIQQAAENPEFITPHTSLVDSIFRIFLKNNNAPLSPAELENHIDHPASTILKTLSGRRIYKGIRPHTTE